MLNFAFIIESIFMGVALAMDAFSVSCANGLNEPKMKFGRMSCIAGTFAFFQIAMPLIGWLCVHTIAELFQSFQKFIPWIALGLLAFLGTKMIIEGIKLNKNPEADSEECAVGFWALMLQGVATSIDALSVGFTIATLSFGPALIQCLIIGVVTFIICIVGLILGKTFGNMLNGKANILGGIILIGIGIYIFVSNVFFG